MSDAKRDAQSLVDDTVEWLTELLLKLGLNTFEIKHLIREKLRD